VHGAALLAAGFLWRLRVARIASAACLVAATLKVFILDLANLEGLARALSFVGLGLTLMAIATLPAPARIGRSSTGSPLSLLVSLPPPPHKPAMTDSQAGEADPHPDIAGLPFERAMQELEEIVRQLATGRVPLEDSINIYERGELGSAIARRCSSAGDGRSTASRCPDGRPTGTSRSTRQLAPADRQQAADARLVRSSAGTSRAAPRRSRHGGRLVCGRSPCAASDRCGGCGVTAASRTLRVAREGVNARRA
jgi:exodeoxyribonuclease VII small subunit